MTPEKRQHLKELQTKLKNLTPEQKEMLTNRGLIATIEGRTLSLHNTWLCYIQSNSTIPTVVGGFKQWLATNRVVSKGQHGMTIWFPVGKHDDDEDIEVERFYTGTVFDISQTEELTSKQTPSNPVKPVAQSPTLTPSPVTPKQQTSSPIEPEIMRGWSLV